MSEQLVLPLGFSDEATFDNFITGDGDNAVGHAVDKRIDAPNDEVLSYLKSLSNNFDTHFLYLWGEAGVGKSHLLQAVYKAALDNQQSAFYINLNDVAQFTPAIFENLEEMELILLDDISAVKNAQEWEEALFHLYNRIRDDNDSDKKNNQDDIIHVHHKILLVADRLPPSEAQFRLADLNSRLTSGVTFHLHELNNEQKRAALKLHASRRGINLSDQILDYIFNNFSRTMRDLFKLLEKLEKQSLIEKRRITLPFVRKVMFVG